MSAFDSSPSAIPATRDSLRPLGLPDWVYAWSKEPPPPAEVSPELLVVAYGLVRSLPMLNVTLHSLERHAPARTRLAVHAYSNPGESVSARTRILASPISIDSIGLTELWNRPTLDVCTSNNTRAEHRNELEAYRLLSGVGNWKADVVVLWRIDTELVDLLDVHSSQPWRHPRQVVVPYLQSGGFLNDRLMLGHPAAIRKLHEARIERLASECVYGEPLLVNVIKQLHLTIGFTRSRIVRRRSNLSIPKVDVVAALGRKSPSMWMKAINAFPVDEFDCSLSADGPVCMAPADRNAPITTLGVPPRASSRQFGTHGVPHSCPYFRTWESRCQWSEPLPWISTPSLARLQLERLIFLGDSLDAQLFAAVACLFYERRGALKLTFDANWDNSVRALRKRCDSLTQCHYTSATLNLSGANAPFREMHLCQDSRAACLEQLAYNPRTDVVVTGLNALHGAAHGVRRMFVHGIMNATLAAVEARKDVRSVFSLVPAGRLVWREATAQHFSAPGGHWLHGFMLRTNEEKLESRCSQITVSSMRQHSHWNPAAEVLLECLEVPILRTWNASAEAWYAHTDHGDCTHFCQPGVVTVWAAQLLRLLSERFGAVPLK